MIRQGVAWSLKVDLDTVEWRRRNCVGRGTISNDKDITIDVPGRTHRGTGTLRKFLEMDPMRHPMAADWPRDIAVVVIGRGDIMDAALWHQNLLRFVPQPTKPLGQQQDQEAIQSVVCGKVLAAMHELEVLWCSRELAFERLVQRADVAGLSPQPVNDGRGRLAERHALDGGHPGLPRGGSDDSDPRCSAAPARGPAELPGSSRTVQLSLAQ